MVNEEKYRGPVGFREALLQCGLWGDFCTRMEELQTRDKLKPSEAWRVAEDEFRPKLMSATPAVASKEQSEIGPSGAASTPAGGQGPSDDPTDGSSKVARPEFYEGKPKSSYLEDCTWASENAGMAGITPMDAPSGRAWNLMLHVQKKPEFLKEVLLLIARKSAEQDRDEEVDRDCRKSQKELDALIDRVEAAAAERLGVPAGSLSMFPNGRPWREPVPPGEMSAGSIT